MAVLGTPDADLYDLTEGGDEEEGALVDAARTSRYRQVVRDLREQILRGEPAPGQPLDGQSKLADTHGTDSALINRALAVLRAEGLVRVEHGRKTIVLERQAWHLEFEARVPLDDRVRRAARTAVASRLAAAVAGQPAISAAPVQTSSRGVLITVTVESAHLAGAVTAALPVAAQAAGEYPIVVTSGSEA